MTLFEIHIRYFYYNWGIIDFFFGDIFVAQYTSDAWQFIQDYNRLYALLISHKHITFTPTHIHKWKLCLSAIHNEVDKQSELEKDERRRLHWINFCRCYFLSLLLLIWNLNFSSYFPFHVCLLVSFLFLLLVLLAL